MIEAPEKGALVTVRDEFGQITVGTFRGVAAGNPKGNSRWDREPKWIVDSRPLAFVVSHIPASSVRGVEVK